MLAQGAAGSAWKESTVATLTAPRSRIASPRPGAASWRGAPSSWAPAPCGCRAKSAWMIATWALTQFRHQGFCFWCNPELDPVESRSKSNLILSLHLLA